MTLQERQQAMQIELRILQQKYGLEIVPAIQPQQFGSMWQMIPVVQLVEIPGWQPTASEENTEAHATQNGKGKLESARPGALEKPRGK